MLFLKLAPILIGCLELIPKGVDIETVKGGDDIKNSILSVSLGLAILASSAVAAEQKMTCRVTGKTMDQCCCEMKGGKFYCKLTKKTYDQCCCDMK